MSGAESAESMGSLIIVIGNPVSGLSFFGPFDSNEDVHSFVKRERLKTWWLAQLITAERDEKGERR